MQRVEKKIHLRHNSKCKIIQHAEKINLGHTSKW